MDASLLSAASSFDTAMMTANSRKLDAAQMGNIKKAAKEFESMFVSEMLSHMFNSVEVDPEFGGGKGEEMFRSLLVQEYGKKIAEGPGIGISDQIQRMMIEMQQNAKGA